MYCLILDLVEASVSKIKNFELQWIGLEKVLFIFLVFFLFLVDDSRGALDKFRGDLQYRKYDKGNEMEIKNPLVLL